MFWEQRSEANTVMVSGAISCNCFETIFSHLHVTSNADLGPLDKFFKF